MPEPLVAPGHEVPTALPTGTLTFLFTDIEGSTRLWEQAPNAMRQAHARHGEIAASCVASYGGHLVLERGEGDSTFSVFPLPQSALAAAADIQKSLQTEPWPSEAPIRVRAALHTGSALLRDGSYHSADVNRCARLRALACGGQTLLSQAAAHLVQEVLPEGISLRDLGLHRLKDLSRPEHVSQMVHPDLPSDFPPIRSLDSLPTNLPTQMTSFVGRQAESAAIKRLLAVHRLLTLTGPGGAGKTRLALQVAADLLDDFPGGCWLVDLTRLTDPRLLPQVAAQAVGVREESGCSLTVTLTQHLRPAPALLILDNCEHLLAACESLAEALLQGCPALRILATSQQALGLLGTGKYAVPPLSLPPERAGRGELEQFEAVRLFTERALAAQSRFVLTDANAPAVAQTCRRLSGIPLALELAAAWVDVLTPEKIARRLDDRFQLLTRGNEAAVPRHQTLRETIDWSCALLSEAERTLFTRLSLFAGGWTLEAAESVCTGNGIDEADILPLLSRLVDKSLVSVEEAPEGETRYHLLESLRQYSRETLDALDTAPALHARMSQFFLMLGAEAEAHLDGPEEPLWLDRLEREQENLRAVLEWTQSHAPEACLQLAVHVYWLWYLRGYAGEWRGWLETGLRQAPDAPAALRAKALTGAGILADTAGDLPAARNWYAQALAVKQEIGDRRGVAGTVSNLAILATQEGDLAGARSLFEQSLELYRELNNRTRIAALLGNLGLIAGEQGDTESAVAMLSESLSIHREMKNSAGQGKALENLGEICRIQGNFSCAIRFLRESYTFQKEVGDKAGIAEITRTLGLILHEQEKFIQSLELLSAGDALRNLSGVSLDAPKQAEYNAALAALKKTLTPGVYHEIWKQGPLLSLDQLIESVSTEGKHSREN